jgi:hypothetical protein
VRRFKTHIAYIVTGIFLFPLIFQSLHIVRYHSGHELKNHEPLCCERHHNSSPDHQASVSESEKHCPIREYQFSLNILPDTSVFEANIPDRVFAFTDIPDGQPHHNRIAYKLTRAPPFSL